MNSSGKKRGVAIAAVSGLALTGLAFAAPAQAQTIGGSGTPLTLYSQYTGFASTAPDGANSTVTLLAGMPTSIGGELVNSVRFSYEGGVIGQVIPQDGVAMHQWAAPAGTHTITVDALDNGGNVLATTSRAGVSSSPTHPTVAFDNAPFAETGQWDNAVVVHGLMGNGGDFVNVRALGPEAASPDVGAPLSAAPGPFHAFTGVIPLGANNTADAVDQVVVGASTANLDAPGGQSDDVTVLNVYDQKVDNVTKSLKAGSVDLVPAGGADDATTYVLKVTDQKGHVIHGVDVYESDAAGAPAPGGNGAPNAGETDTNGEFEATLHESTIDNAADLDPTANTQLTYYVVDVNQDGNYDNGTDWKFALRQSKYTQTPTTVEISNSLGMAMDDDEHSTLTFTVKDQSGAPVPGATVRYKIDRVGHQPVADPAGTYADLAPTNAQGKTTLPFAPHNDQTEVNTVNAYMNLNGTPIPDSGDAIATPYVIDTDMAQTVWDQGTRAQFPANTTQTVSGKLVLPHFNNKALPGRPLDLDFTSGTTPLANAIFAPQAAQPAGTVRGSDHEAEATTSATGVFSAALLDPATPVGQELDSRIQADTDWTHPTGLWFEQYQPVLHVDWLRSLTPSKVEIRNYNNGHLDSLWSPFAGNDNLQPGKLGLGYVEAYNSDGAQLYDLKLPVSIIEGNFVNMNNLYDPTPVVGGKAGEWSSLGKSTEVNTGDTGEGVFMVNIERNAGFDDDGLVSDKVIAGTGLASFEHDFKWNTRDIPLNSGSFSVTLSSHQESTVLPKARAGTGPAAQSVFYDVVATDQFGNRTQQPLTIDDNTPVADFHSSNKTMYTLDGPAIEAFSPSTANQSLEVQLDQQTSTLYKDNPYTSVFDPAHPFDWTTLFDTPSADIQKVTDPINWYLVDLSRSSFVLDHQGADQVRTGTAVTMTLTAKDQEGQALNDYAAEFLRTGPGDADDDTYHTGWLPTDMHGQAFYDFVGSKPGIASITAVVRDDLMNRVGTFGPDTVEFTGNGHMAITATLKGENAGKKDVLTVSTKPAAPGAQVKLYKKTDSGKRLLAIGSLDSNGLKTFMVKDHNGRSFTRYFAVVHSTSTTGGDTSNTVKLR